MKPCLFVAKTDNKDDDKWLPLYVHLKDTAGVMRKLIKIWLADSVIKAAGLDFESFLKAACFLAAIHDIGKATSYFQSIITSKLPEKREELNKNGFVVGDVYRDAGKTPHAYAGEEIIKHLFGRQDLSEKEKLKINNYASVVGAHHGKPKSDEYVSGVKVDYFSYYKRNIFGTKEDKVIILWEKAWNRIIETAFAESRVEGFEELPDINLEAQTIISGLLIIADWIASNTYYFPLFEINGYYADIYPGRIEYGWDKLLFPEKWESETYCMDEGEFRSRFGFFPNEVQNKFIDIVNKTKSPGLFILEAQMGVGKTEAALAAAEVLANRCGNSGIFFGLPTQATSNGLFVRLIRWASKVSEDTLNAIRLAHSSADLNDEYRKYDFMGMASLDEDGGENGIAIHPWFQGNKKALLADFVVGTVDQFLLATLKRRHYMLRHLGLSGKVVIIDECHAYDAYMNVYLINSLRWMGAYGIPVVLLSATLPKERRVEFTEAYSKYYVKCFMKADIKQIVEKEGWRENSSYPLFTWTDGLAVNQESVEIAPESKYVKISYSESLEEVLLNLDEKLSDGGCACMILNTVKKAQDVYEKAKEILNDVKIIFYHAQFIIPDRGEKEKELLRVMGKESNDEDRGKSLLIGTQVLEQSLDYDADIMVTQICPIDLLLQRIGRLHRHERRRPDRLKNRECIVLLEHDGDSLYDKGSEKIYGNYLLMRSMNLLKEYNDRISIPEDVSEMVQKVYDVNYKLGESDEYQQEYMEILAGKKRRAKNFSLGFPNIKANKNLDGILSCESVGDSEAAVRDSSGTIEVILMKMKSDGTVGFVDKDSCGVVYRDQIPDEKTARCIARQKIKLPSVFTTKYLLNKTIIELEDKTRKELAVWQKSPWLEGELVLLLNENSQGKLGDYDISYSKEKGFEYNKCNGKDKIYGKDI